MRDLVCVSGWVRVYTIVCRVVKNLQSDEGKSLHENGSPRISHQHKLVPVLCSFSTFLALLHLQVCVCMCVLCLDFTWLAGAHYHLFIYWMEAAKQTKMCLPFASLEHSISARLHQICTFVTRGVGDISRCRVQDNQERTITCYFSLGSLLRPPFRLSSLVYLRLYSLERLYTTAKSQEPDCFHVLGFIAGFLSC